MQTEEPSTTREATEILMKIIDSNFTKEDLKQVNDNATQLNAKERTQLLRLLKDFEDLFDGTLGDWCTYPIDPELNPGSKPFISKYDPVPKMNRETFCK